MGISQSKVDVIKSQLKDTIQTEMREEFRRMLSEMNAHQQHVVTLNNDSGDRSLNVSSGPISNSVAVNPTMTDNHFINQATRPLIQHSEDQPIPRVIDVARRTSLQPNTTKDFFENAASNVIPDNRKRSSTRLSVTGGTLTALGAAAIGFVGTAISESGLPFTGSTVQLISAVINAYQVNAENNEVCMQILVQLNYVVTFMMEVRESDLKADIAGKKLTMEKTLLKTEDEVREVFTAAQNFVQIYKRQNIFVKLVNSSTNRTNFEKLNRKIDKLMQRFTTEKILSHVSTPSRPLFAEGLHKFEQELSQITGIDYKRGPREVLKVLKNLTEKVEVRARLEQLFGNDWESDLASLEEDVRLKASDQGILLNLPILMYEYWIGAHGTCYSVKWITFYSYLKRDPKLTELINAVSERVVKYYFVNLLEENIDLSDFSRFAHKCLSWQREFDPEFDIDNMDITLAFKLLSKYFDKSIHEKERWYFVR